MRAVGWLAILLGLASALSGLAFAVMLPTGVPYGDIIDFFRRFLAAGGFAGYGFDEFYFAHNEHRLVVPRLWFLLDVAIVDGRQTLVIAVTILSLAAHAGLLTWLFHRMGGSERALWVVFTVLLGMFLSPVQHEHLLNGFQVQFVQVWFFATASFALIVAAPVGEGRVVAVAASVLGAILFALMSTYTMINGAVVWPLLVIFALWRRIPLVWTLVLVVAATLILTIEVTGFEPHAGHGSPLDSLNRPIDVLLFMARYLTSGLKAIGTLEQEILGIVCLLTIIVIGVRALVRPRDVSPARMALLGVAGFVIAAALATALGRLPFGLGSANTSRYATPSFVFLAVVALLAFDYMRRRSSPRVVVLGSGFGVALLLVPGLVQGLIEVPFRLAGADYQRLAVASHLAGGHRPETLRMIYPHWAPRPSMVLDRMREAGLGPFSIEASFRPPPGIEALRGQPELVCDGHVDRLRVDPVTGVEAEGWILDRETARHPLWVLLRDGDGDVIAWGGSLLRREDLVAALPSGMHARAFLAFGSAPTSKGVDAVTVEGVFDDGRRCRLTASAMPGAPRFIDALPAGATPALVTTWSVDPTSANGESGGTDAPDLARPVLGSIGQEDRRFRATAALGDPAGGTAVAVPVRTGAYPFRTSVALVASDGQVLDSFVLDRSTADTWRWLILRGGPFADGMRLEIQVPTNHPGNGLAFGTPYWLSEG